MKQKNVLKSQIFNLKRDGNGPSGYFILKLNKEKFVWKKSTVSKKMKGKRSLID